MPGQEDALACPESRIDGVLRRSAHRHTHQGAAACQQTGEQKTCDDGAALSGRFEVQGSRGTVQERVLPPVSTEGWTREDIAEHASALRDRMAHIVETWNEDPGP